MYRTFFGKKAMIREKKAMMRVTLKSKIKTQINGLNKYSLSYSIFNTGKVSINIQIKRFKTK